MSTEPAAPSAVNQYVFGPVPSRRLGISLGIDVVPYKTCNLNCLYCECGPTTHFINRRERFVNPGEVLKQIREVVSEIPYLDYITFSGAGEPTLNSDLGYFIHEIKTLTSCPIAVLTNGCLLSDIQVRSEIAPADVVLPSLDAATPEVFHAINQPHTGLRIDEIVEGLALFRQEYPGNIWLEIFILEGINTGKEELEALRRAIHRIRPDKVQLNTLDRPPAFPNVRPASMRVLESIRREWSELPVEIIKRVHERKDMLHFSRNLENSLMNAIRRRPLTLDDLLKMTGMERRELESYLDILEKEKKVIPTIVGPTIFFKRG